MKSKQVELVHNIFFGLIILACFVLTIVFRLSILTFVACASSIAYIVFLSERNILNFIIGFISSTTYIFISYKAKLYGEVIFYLIVDLPMIFISFAMWKRHMETKFKVESKKMSAKGLGVMVIASAVVTFAYGLLLRALGDVNPFVDALSTVVSFVATGLMALRYREQWAMWVIVYAVSIILWAVTFDLLMLIMSVACFLSCIQGFITWSKASKKTNLENKMSQT